MLPGKSLKYVVHKKCFMGEWAPQFLWCTVFLKVCVSVNKAFYNVYSMFITFSFSTNYVVHCELKISPALFIFCGSAFTWLGRWGDFVQKGSQWLDFLLSPPVRFFYINFLYILPVPMQTVPVYIPSLFYQYFDSSENAVCLKLERACCFSFSHLWNTLVCYLYIFIESECLCYSSSSSRKYMVFLYSSEKKNKKVYLSYSDLLSLGNKQKKWRTPARR